MELGQTRSPRDLIPGSVSNARTSAEAWKAKSAEATRVRHELSTLDDEGTWRGDAYDAYLERFQRQLLHWKRTGEWLQAGASALFTWADALQWAQDEADRAIDLWDEAERQGAAALAAHRARVRELRVGQGLRHPDVDVPFVDPTGPARAEAQEVLFNARATLEVFARDCAIRLDEAAAAAAMPLTESEAGDATMTAATAVVIDVAVIQPFLATMDMLAVSARTLWEHPDIILELLGGAATFLGGAAMVISGGGLTVTGAGALAGAPALAVAGVGVAGAGAAIVGNASGRWLNEARSTDTRKGVDRGDGRDYEGKYARGQNNKPWVDSEKAGLDRVAKESNVDVIRTKIRVDFPGSPQNGRYYDGLIKNADGTYTSVEIKSGSAHANYYRPGSTQQQFDDAVNKGAVAKGQLDGEDIEITSVIVRKEP